MIFFQLILAHLIGDFILQPNSWVKDKEQRRIKSPYLILHCLLHGFLTILLLGDWSLWWIALIVMFTHFIIDVTKLHYQKPRNKRRWFFIDQALHILVIAVLAVVYQCLVLKSYYIDFSILQNETFLKTITAIIFLTLPSSILIKNLISFWTPNPQTTETVQTDSLANAGQYIGILERLLVFVFILINQWEGVGFMIAAKSVFRFSDLAQAKQRKLTEYVLIGTLLSFGLAILCGILVGI